MTVVVKILRIVNLIKKIGIARSTIYDWMNEKSPRYDPTFPRSIRLGNGRSRAVGWLESDIDTWLLNRKDPA